MSFKWSLIASMVLVVGVAVGLTGTSVYWATNQVLVPAERTQQLKAAANLSRTLEVLSRNVTEDAQAISSGTSLRRVLSDDSATNDPATWTAIVEDNARGFEALLRAKPYYLQARLIRATDDQREILRVDRSGAGEPPRRVTGDALQVKGYLPYVQSVATTPDAAVVLSDLELNREYEKVQLPPVPILRASTPFHDAEGRFLGAFVINVDLRQGLEAFRRDGGDHAFLLNANDDLLVYADQSKEFSFEFGKAYRFADAFPAIGSLSDVNAPLSKDIKTHAGDDAFLSVVPFQLTNGPTLRVATVIPSSNVATLVAFENSIVIVTLVTLLLSLGLALVLANSVTSPLAQMTKSAAQFPTDTPDQLPTEAAGEIGLLARTLARMNTEVLRNQGTLQARERQFRDIIEASPVAKLLVDSNRKIVHANQSAQQLFGFSAAELLELTIDELVPVLGKDTPSQEFAEYFANPTNVRLGGDTGEPVTATRKAGDTIAIELSLNALPTDDKVTTLVSIIDISHHATRQAALQRSNSDLEQFAYVASHGLQEPLRMVASYTERLSSRYEGQLDEKAQRSLFYAADGARRMQRMVKDLLLFARVGSTYAKPLAPVSANSVLKQVLFSLRLAIEDAKATVEFSKLPVIDADETQLFQLFENLITNALKFRGKDPPRVSISAEADGDFWEFKVKDNGIGIDMAMAPRIFEMFQRLHPVGTFEGSGIGLAVVQRIVERHGGEISVSSVVGEGTCFNIRLPANSVDTATEPDAAKDNDADNHGLNAKA